MKRYIVYMLLCSDGSFYVGITNDLQRRVGEHNFGCDPDAYTHVRRPVCLVHSSKFQDVKQAIMWEKQLKGWSRAKKRALVSDARNQIESLSKRRAGRARPSRLAALAPQDDSA